MQRIRLTHDGKEIEIIAQKIQGRLWFHWNGETHVYEPAPDRKGAKASAEVNPHVIAAPMPGKILRVEIKAGEPVESGHILIVMEAMKMEYTLSAAVSALVAEVTCKVGEQVRLGQILVRLKDEKNG